MKTVEGLQALIAAKQDLSQVGWIFVDKDFDKTSANALMAAQFYVSENDDDDFYGENHLATWMEAPTFLDIFDVRTMQLKDPTVMDIAIAAVYYLEKDAFLEDISP